MKNLLTTTLKSFQKYPLIPAFAFFVSVNSYAQTAPAKQWDKTIGGSGIEFFHGLDQTADGGYILGGFSNSSNNGDKSQVSKGSFDYWFVKLDAAGNKSWDKTYGGSGADIMYAIQQTNDGGYILGGATSSALGGDKTQPLQGEYDFWVIKTDASGNKIWDKSFGGSSNDRLYALQQTKDGGYILGGFSGSGISGDKTQPTNGGVDFWVVKIDASGNKQWDKAFGGNDSDILYSVKELAAGGYILGGYSNSGISGSKSEAGRGDLDYWIVRLDATGNKVWDKTFGGNALDDLKVVEETNDGGFILGGFSESIISGDKTQSPIGDSDYWIVKTDASGTKLWDKTLGGTGSDNLFSMKQTTDNGFILAGFSNSDVTGDKSQVSQGQLDYWIVKVTSNGNKVWDLTFGGSAEDRLSAIKQTSDGGFIFGGYSGSGQNIDKTQPSKGGNDYWIVKLGPEITGFKESVATFSLSIYPNPNQGKFKLQLDNVTGTKAEVKISDLLGRMIIQKELAVTDRQLAEELTLPAAKGMYLLQIKAGNEVITRKIVVE